MHYHIYCNQKNVSNHHALAWKEYQKRLSAYCETSLHLETSLQFTKELQKKNHLLVVLQNGPSTESSEQFANRISQLQSNGKSTIHVCIGYDEGTVCTALSTLTEYDTPMFFSISNSSLSTPTKTLFFYEQLYRAYTILQGKTYHK